jgi:hypothetical protein
LLWKPSKGLRARVLGKVRARLVIQEDELVELGELMQI